MVKVKRAFCWHKKFVPKGFSALAPGLYTCIKSWKRCIKSGFEEIILKLATYGQREKAFLLSSKFCPQGVVCPCLGAICMYKSIKIYTKTRCQVSVYRTTGPLLVIFAINLTYSESNSQLTLLRYKFYHFLFIYKRTASQCANHFELCWGINFITFFLFIKEQHHSVLTILISSDFYLKLLQTVHRILQMVIETWTTVNVLKFWTSKKKEHPKFIFSPHHWSKGK